MSNWRDITCSTWMWIEFVTPCCITLHFNGEFFFCEWEMITYGVVSPYVDEHISCLSPPPTRSCFRFNMLDCGSVSLFGLQRNDRPDAHGTWRNDDAWAEEEALTLWSVYESQGHVRCCYLLTETTLAEVCTLWELKKTCHGDNVEIWCSFHCVLCRVSLFFLFSGFDSVSFCIRPLCQTGERRRKKNVRELVRWF